MSKLMTIEDDQPTEIDNFFISYFFEDQFVACNVSFDLSLFNFKRNFYCIKIPRERFKLSFPGDYYLVSGGAKICSKATPGKLDYGIYNRTLIDADYEHDILLGVYIPFDFKESVDVEFKWRIEGIFEEKDDIKIDYFSRTQSPVFNSAPFSISNFHSLYRSTEGANGYDIVLDNIKQAFIEPMGNLVLDLRDTVRTDSSGDFLLRSRYVIAGLSLYHHKGYFYLTNHSLVPVPVARRMFQYVPLGCFNGKVCNTSGVIHTSVSYITQKNRLLKKFGPFGESFTTREKERKSKFRPCLLADY